MSTITLERSGARALQFSGEELARVSTRKLHGPSRRHWQEIRLFRGDNGECVAAVSFYSRGADNAELECVEINEDWAHLERSLSRLPTRAGRPRGGAPYDRALARALRRARSKRFAPKRGPLHA
jgi:hypothetical protein